MKTFLFWAPRILAILIAAFVGLFALDVFSEGYSFWEALVGFVIHLAPTWLILGALLLAWRWERLGGVVFIALGVFFLLWFGLEWTMVLLFLAPLSVIGFLFLADWQYRATHPAAA